MTTSLLHNRSRADSGTRRRGRPMTHKGRHTIAITIAAVALTVLAACGSDTTPTAEAAAPVHGSTAHTTDAPAGDLIDPAVFHADMRKLWEDHITWTRLYIVSAVADLPDLDATAGRLLQNQADIGSAVAPF